MTSLKKNLGKIAEVLSEAFDRDPFIHYIMPEANKRRDNLRWWMDCMAVYGSRYGEITHTGSPIGGVAIWLKPPQAAPETRKMLAVGLLEAPLRIGVKGFKRLIQINKQWEKLRKQETSPYWYLMFLGVRPKSQGQGLGGALLKPMLEKADHAGMNCYLETAAEKNLSFYQKYGFQVVHKGGLGSTGHYWTMRRETKLLAGQG